MNCTTATNLSLKWNWILRFLTNFLLQGDHMSPYVFVLCMEKLAILIQEHVQLGLWHPVVPTRKVSGISSLFGTTLLKDLSNLILLRGQGGIRNLVVESDSTMALKMISEGVSITHAFAALVNSIRSYCDKGNFVADSLASGFA